MHEALFEYPLPKSIIMTQQNHHGAKGHHRMNALCHRQSLEQEQIGRFGRMFTRQQPLYTSPESLTRLGAVHGPMSAAAIADSTDTVPLGMVFLGQFIDHDITLDTTSSLNRVNHPETIDNFRSPALDLDCIFGEGPEDEPFLYEKRSRKLLLLTGESNQNYGQPGGLRQFDLARTAEGVAIIGDPRNDENRIVSQLQLAFIKCYNAHYQELELRYPEKSAKEVYELARQKLTWQYHWIILHEFLPQMVGEGTLQKVLSEGRKYYTPCQSSFIPVEFSAAAYRFGHSMIKNFMRLKTGGPPFELFSPEIGHGFRPVQDFKEVVDWTAFFDFDGTFQRAGQLNTKMAADLLELPPFVPAPRSLAERNLKRGQSFLLPSGETVARCMDRPEDEIKYVQDYALGLVDDFDIDMSLGIPLWYYILAEAECIGRQDLDGNKPGEGLGPTGGTIVAEVLVGLIEMDENSFLNVDRNWTPESGAATIKDLLEKSNHALYNHYNVVY